jgi:hypothetical protein
MSNFSGPEACGFLQVQRQRTYVLMEFRLPPEFHTARSAVGL